MFRHPLCFAALFVAALVRLPGAVLPNPAITAATPASSTTNAVANIFDSLAETTEYRTNGAGNNTFIEFDFGTEVVIDGFLNVTRNSTSSVVTGSRLIFDTDGTAGFAATTDTVVSFTAADTGQVGQGYLNRFPAVTARKVRWEVTANTGSSRSCGAMEMRFLGPSAGATPVTGVGVIAGSPALSSYHALANASNGLAGRTPAGTTILPAVGYAASGAGTATFVDFDLGQRRLISALDFFDQLGADQRVNSFTLTFSDEPSFAAPTAVRNYSNNGFALSASFAAIPARYVRYQVTSCAGANPGLSELVFHETAGASLSQAFAAAANPNQNWQHGEKSAPLAAELTIYQTAAAPDASAPCQRWLPVPDPEEPAPPTAFIGIPAAATAAFDWGGTATDWSTGRVYHAWRDGQPFPVVSRFTVQQAGAYDLAASWHSHTVAGCEAIVSIVVNGGTVFAAGLAGFAGTPHGTPAPSGSAPVVNGAASGIELAAGATVDIVTQPLGPVGNVAVEALITPATTVAEATATVVIREFCASNLNSLRDEDGAFSDWLELYNGTGAAVDLTNWSLTDKANQPRLWVFPPRVLPHGQRLVVFASGKDSAKRPGYGPTSELHTNFALAKTGEFLGLADPGGAFVASFAPAFPQQFDDLSFGLGGNGVVGFMSPTPGVVNQAAAQVPPAVLGFSAPSGLFASSLSVTISGHTASHTVRYTTNGTEPTLAVGQTYTDLPIAITANTTLRARAYANGVPGPLAQACFTKLGTTTQYGVNPATFASALPVLVIDAPATPPSNKTPLVSRFTLLDRDPADGLTRLTAAPALATRGTLKLRGQYSTSFPKKSYTVEFWDGADQPEAHELLGMPRESDWVLYAAYQTDTDFMRNVLMYELHRRMGKWSPRTRFVEVFLNTSASSPADGADYLGVYVLTEKIKLDPNRVDLTRMSPYDNAGEAVTGGYIIARDKWGNLEANHPELLTGNRDGVPNWPFAAGGAFVFKTPSVADLTAAQQAYITNYVLETDAAVGAPDFRNPATGRHVFDYLGRDSFIDHHLLAAFAKNVDGIRISTYFEKDRGGKLRLSALWDYDLSQDADTDDRDNNPNAWNSDNSTASTYFFSVPGRPAEGWFHYLHQIPAYLQDWVDRFDRWRASGVLESAAINAFLDSQAAQLVVPDNNGTPAANTPIARNYARWSRTTRGTATNGSNAAEVIFGTAATSEINRHKAWLQQRLAFMDSWVLQKPVPSLAAGVVAPGSILTLDSPDLTGSARLYYTLDGTDPFDPGGGVSPAASLWTGSLPLTTSTRLTARLHQPSPVNKHTGWSAPLTATYIAGAAAAGAGNLVVSELMYHPADPSPEELAAGFATAEEFEFIELRNAGPTPINLWGARFTQGIGFEFDETLAAAQVELAPGATLLLASRRAAFEFRYGSMAASRVVGEFAAATNLSNAGETLTLVDRTGALILEFTYSDESPWPAAADGGGASLHYLAGTPGQPSSWLAWAPDPGSTIEDHDGDGQSDLYERLAGTDPGAAGSFFQLTITAPPAAGGYTLTFPVAAGHYYRVERSADAVTWEPLDPGFTATTTGTAAVTDPAPGPASGFYRVAASFDP
jgi:hypothetical protein